MTPLRLFALGLLVMVGGCSLSSGGSGTGSANDSPPAPSSPIASVIVDHYDTATCADWAVTDAGNRQIVALYYANEFNDPQPADDGDAIAEAITTACASYGAGETPQHIAKVSIETVYGT